MSANSICYNSAFWRILLLLLVMLNPDFFQIRISVSIILIGTVQCDVTAEGLSNTVAAETPRGAVAPRSCDAVPAARLRNAIITARSHDGAAAARRLAFHVYEVQGHNLRKVKVTRLKVEVIHQSQGHSSRLQ